MAARVFSRAAVATAALAVLVVPGPVSGPLSGPVPGPPPAHAQSPDQDPGTGNCSFPSKPYEGRPWSLQRVLLDELWDASENPKTGTREGAGIKVAVIDTGVNTQNPQLTDAVEAKLGENLIPKKPEKNENGGADPRGNARGTTDTVGHGTKVAGIIAARPLKGTGFVGLAPRATIIPIKQNDSNGSGTALTLAEAITSAVAKGAKVINISQDTAQALGPNSALQQAVSNAIRRNVVIVASAGNDGVAGNEKITYPASYEGVLAVAASDRNNERAPFSQSGDFVGIAAPGVDMISTVPRKGHCADNGTSFSAPYVAGVAALLRAKHPDWKPHEVIAQLQQTAERTIAGHDERVGWGVVDPIRALTEDDERPQAPSERGGLEQAERPRAATLRFGETTQERNERLGTYAVVGGGVLVAVIAGAAVVQRDRRRRQGAGN
ncbi:type VII secretion-associated serine protease mycosin [Streptomyces boninensis]|uniref:type VII secretion-associated serine protease mycosin n=1 Tax=Streptomyces boninensis TaxID=2039455 RepID=UPI003B21C0CC